MLSQLNDTAGQMMRDYIAKNGYEDTEAIVDYAYGLVTKYGEGSAALAAEMYDETARLSGKTLPPAEVADTASYGDVKTAINTVARRSINASSYGNTVSRFVKRAGADTTIQNAVRDEAEYAWIPSGDSCPLCIAIASRGFQHISRKSMRKGHAEHIHSNCDCNYTVRFDSSSGVEGYDPDEYLQMYESADGNNARAKINAMRRAQYQDPERHERILAQKRAAYAEKHKMDYRHERDISKTIDAIVKEGKITAKQIIGSPNGIYVSDELTIKPKKLQEIENDITEAKQIVGVEGKEEPRFIIVADTELGNAGGRYDAKTNTIYYKALIDKKLQRHVAIHELYHWDDAQAYLKEGKTIKSNQDIIDYASAKAKRILDRMGINSDNVSEFNDFCERAYSRGRFDEVYTEIRTLRSLK